MALQFTLIVFIIHTLLLNFSISWGGCEAKHSITSAVLGC